MPCSLLYYACCTNLKSVQREAPPTNTFDKEQRAAQHEVPTRGPYIRPGRGLSTASYCRRVKAPLASLTRANTPLIPDTRDEEEEKKEGEEMEAGVREWMRERGSIYN